MIIDTVKNLKKYVALNPRFLSVAEFLERNALERVPLGRHPVCGDEVYVNVVEQPIKSRENARIETHDEMIDIQIAISGPEEHGFTPRGCLAASDYDATKDISFYPGRAQTYFTIFPGTFVIYFPDDAHAPGITPTGTRKAIFKVKA